MDFSAVLAGTAVPPKTGVAAAPVMSMAERMALMRKSKAPEPVKKVDDAKKRDVKINEKKDKPVKEKLKPEKTEMKIKMNTITKPKLDKPAIVKPDKPLKEKKDKPP